jgi:hypothetical protein
MLGGAGPANREQALLGLWSCDPRQRTDLGVRQLTARERLRQPRQRAERTRDANVLTRSARLEPEAPREPRRARAKAIAPAAARVEFANEIEQSRGGGVEMGGELGDLIAEALGTKLGPSMFIGAPPRSAPNLHLDFRASGAPLERAIVERSMILSVRTVDVSSQRHRGPLGPHILAAASARPPVFEKAVKRNLWSVPQTDQT